MAVKCRPKKKVLSPEEKIQEAISNIVVDSEYRNASNMQDAEMRDFESLLDIVEGRRNEKDYDWMSDYHIPEFNSILHAEAADWAGEMFSTRDFCEAKLDGEDKLDIFKANAAKKVVNKTLNDRDLFYYPKYMRLRTINSLIGKAYVVCWWEQEVVNEKRKIVRPKPLDIDVLGNPITDPTRQMPAMEMAEEEIDVEKVVIDHFNFDVCDPRNVFTDNKYCYSVQHKDWVIIRAESSYSSLKEKELSNSYFNLDKVKEAIIGRKEQSDTAKETYAKDASGQIDKTPVQNFDILDRYGKFWAIVTEKDKWGNPSKATPGIDENGLPSDNAELIEMIITYVLIGNTKIMIRFEPTPWISAAGKPFKPIARALCYIHPTKDEGLSDGKNARELQIAIDDTFNMSSDRVKLATLPTFIGNKNNQDDIDFYMEPEHINWVNDVDRDLKELKISSDVTGALEQLGLLTNKMQQVTARFPTTMGALPDSASTTATAVAGADQRTNARHHYKSLTFEYMFLTEFYWIILQMTYRHAKPETILKMLGQDAVYFDANADYTYSPVSSAIESEFNKNKKVQLLDQMQGRIAGMIPILPKLVPIVARIVQRQFELLGDEEHNFKKLVDDLAQSKPQQEGAQPNQIKDMKDQATSNQNGMMISPMEADTRNAQMMGGMMNR